MDQTLQSRDEEMVSGPVRSGEQVGAASVEVCPVPQRANGSDRSEGAADARPQNVRGMNLVYPKGKRTRYTWREVATELAMSCAQVRRYVESGALQKRYFDSTFPFDQQDLNQFIVRFNAGKIK